MDPVSTLIMGRKFTSGLTDPSRDHFSSYPLLCSFSPPVSTTWNVVLLFFSAWLTPAVFPSQVAMLPLPTLFATSLRPPQAGCTAPAASPTSPALIDLQLPRQHWFDYQPLCPMRAGTAYLAYHGIPRDKYRVWGKMGPQYKFLSK